MKNKWSKMDILILVLQIVSPLAAIVVTIIPQIVNHLSEDVRLAIVGAGISIPIVLLQISVTVGQNKDASDVEDLNKKYEDISEKLNHISPLLERVFITGNDRTKRFVYRRMDEVSKQIQTALNEKNSGDLRPNEYYEELLYLADLIIKDQAENKKNFKGEIWAMTSFADEEWLEDAGYERLWTAKLREMVNNGIKTRRICVIPNAVFEILSLNVFDSQTAEKVKSFKGFVSYLQDYYNPSQKSKKTAEHYGIRPSESRELSSIKGFFAIKLSSGELHILHGETINENGALTAKVLFDSAEIQTLRNLFERYATSTFELSKVINRVSKKESGLIEYFVHKNIEL